MLPCLGLGVSGIVACREINWFGNNGWRPKSDNCSSIGPNQLIRMQASIPDKPCITELYYDNCKISICGEDTACA